MKYNAFESRSQLSILLLTVFKIDKTKNDVDITLGMMQMRSHPSYANWRNTNYDEITVR